MMIACVAVIFASAMVLSWLAGKHSRAMDTDGESVRRRAHDEQRQGGRTGKGTTREQVQEDLE